jgi:hypothetical protein
LNALSTYLMKEKFRNLLFQRDGYDLAGDIN